jgi:hypothetical protein
MKMLQWQNAVKLSSTVVIRGVNKKCEFNGALPVPETRIDKP